MINSKGYNIPKKVIKIINRFLRAEDSMTWMGGTDPRDWNNVRNEYRASRKEFLDMINEFCNNTGL